MMTRIAVLTLCLFPVVSRDLLAQSLPQLEAGLTPPPKEVVLAYLTRIADGQLQQRRARIAKIRNARQVEQRRSEIRKTILELIGGLPAERTPLNMRRTGTLDRGGYRIEKIIYESLPEFFVTAALYIPQQGSPPYPAVFHALGHDQPGKASANLQMFAIGLVKLGFVVLAIDPVGQGERRVFFDEQIRTSRVGKASMEHQMVGVQSLLGGESLARYMIWDALRGIDLLDSLAEVDRSRIGITGCSGGGMLTAYLAALDDRIRVAAPACWISAWEEQIRGTGPQDAEQHFHEQLERGINHADYVLAFAPKPYLICATEGDFFPVDGARRTFEESRRIYRLLDAEEKISLFVGPGPHGVPEPSRKAIYAWMVRWLKGAGTGAAADDSNFIEHEQALYSTSTGQVTTALGSETPSTLNIERFAKLVPPRPALQSVEALDRLRARLREDVPALTRYHPSKAPLNVRSLRSVGRGGYTVEQLLYDADYERYVPALLCHPSPSRSKNRSLIYVDQGGKSAGLEGGAADEFARLGYTVLAIDVAGTGETAADSGRPSAWTTANQDLTWLALMVGKSLVGLQMADIIRGLDVLEEKGLLHDGRAIAVGRGLAAVSLLHAAAIDSRIESLAVEESLISYKAVAESPIHSKIFEVVIPGVLRRYDLQDLLAAMAPRIVCLVNLRSPLQQQALLTEAEAHYRYAREAYRALGAEERLRIGLRREGESMPVVCPETVPHKAQN